MYVKADEYNILKEKYSDFGFTPELTCVDLNEAYVPMKVTKESKNSDTDMDKAAECNLRRFGLNQY